MKQVTLVFLFLLLAIAYCYASSNPAEEAEHWEKVRQLDQLAERFKVETGFTGSIIKDHDEHKMRIIRGKFLDISFPDLADTLVTRQSCDAILAKILPYVGFEGLTLTKTPIVYNKSSLRTYYAQLVDGYSFEWRRGLDISYDSNSEKVKIVVGILKDDISPVHVNYTFAQAVEIARQYYVNALGYPDTLSFKNPDRDDQVFLGTIVYKTINYVGTKYVYDKGVYRLCHIFGISVPYGIAGYRAAYIDAHTGEVYKIFDDSIEFTN